MASVKKVVLVLAGAVVALVELAQMKVGGDAFNAELSRARPPAEKPVTASRPKPQLIGTIQAVSVEEIELFGGPSTDGGYTVVFNPLLPRNDTIY